MAQPFTLLVLAWFSIALGGCAPREEKIHHEELIAFGTIVSLTIYGVDDQLATKAVGSVNSMFERQHNDWHAWQKGQLTELNDGISAGKTVRVDQSIVELIQLAQLFEKTSLGLFNPAIGKLLRLWGFQQSEAPMGPPPSKEAIQAWLASKPSSLDLEVDGQSVRSNNTEASLDFGGFAKGYSVGKATHLIETMGIDNFVVNAGGDLCIRGRHGDRPWRIGVRHPNGTDILASIALEGATCLFTSGNYERYFDYNGERYHHILDPASGYPASSSVSVTVLAKDPTLADAAATALFVAGPERFNTIAASMGIEEMLLIDDQGNAYITAGLREQLKFEQPPESLYTMRIGGS